MCNRSLLIIQAEKQIIRNTATHCQRVFKTIVDEFDGNGVLQRAGWQNLTTADTKPPKSNVKQ